MSPELKPRCSNKIVTIYADTATDLTMQNISNQQVARLPLETWGAQNGVTPQEAMEYMRQQYHDVQHTLNWYCLDYWSEQLGLDICAMTTEMGVDRGL